jgi:hypothetical protein
MNEAAEPFSLEAAWDALRAWAKAMVNAFGEPASIAAQLLLRRSSREDILAWLAPLEAGVRRVLLMEAVKLARPNEPPAPIMRGRIATAFREEPSRTLPEDSTQWRTSFRVWPAITRCEAVPAQPAIRASKRAIHYNSYPLARRIEAVIRVFENPAAYIAKIARRIHVEPAQTRAVFRPFQSSLRGAQFMLRDINRETELALEALNSS